RATSTTSPRSPTFSTSVRRMTCMARAPSGGGVRQQRHLARALYGDGDLPLVAPAGAGDPAGADFPLLGDEPPELVRVLVVDLVDLVAAELAGPPLDWPGGRAAASAALLSSPRFGHQKGMSSSVAEDEKSAFSCWAPVGTNCRSPPSPSPRPPMNWTWSAMISTACRLVPSCASPSRQSRRPSTATARPFERYCAQLSPWLPQTVTSK